MKAIEIDCGFFIYMARNYILILAINLLFSCNTPELKEPVEYKGPLREIEKVETFYTKNDKIQAKILADLVYEFENGDREFPKGVYLEFYNEFGRLESVLKANHAFFFKEENKWRGRGNVEVKNLEKREQLNTEELFWKPAEQTISTESFVTIRKEGDIVYGVGLDANQDLSDYTIWKVHGEMEVEE